MIDISHMMCWDSALYCEISVTTGGRLVSPAVLLNRQAGGMVLLFWRGKKY